MQSRANNISRPCGTKVVALSFTLETQSCKSELSDDHTNLKLRVTTFVLQGLHI